MRERLERFRSQFDHFRSAIVNEPRGSDAMVGAILCEPEDPRNAAGIIFFNNVGYCAYVRARVDRAGGYARVFEADYSRGSIGLRLRWGM